MSSGDEEACNRTQITSWTVFPHSCLSIARSEFFSESVPREGDSKSMTLHFPLEKKKSNIFLLFVSLHNHM